MQDKKKVTFANPIERVSFYDKHEAYLFEKMRRDDLLEDASNITIAVINSRNVSALKKLAEKCMESAKKYVCAVTSR